ncbi:DAK2 domain-containing protein [Nocardia implantans]|uniref:DAK2 domain-containing protein n=1 Tax=Nocardia implantans TaxID=3108168 RepID=A0ABU6ATD0_9NOCA|nr:MULTISPECIES: DAK2 domain-containing protein [unclassified Nocardia]MBF6191074.1 DAK2 domain-containing protein [Nocardia beijingensis]MEA3529071.1 DAK2 domain-containing protein [Nocardia sp. CDC192]MEB3510736.1 DAK2 domain-containing protein [Nocardia sp. CDC186]
MDGTALLRWGRTCLAGLEQRRDEINALNVFPVPDADTGTNLLATMRAAVEAGEGAARANGSASAVAVAMAHGATVGARGNSGIILSQVLRGVADTVHRGPFTADNLRAALARASELVREALSVPIEGTILTVLDCATAAAAGCPDQELADVALAAADGAAKALGDTPFQLGVLRRAGVVDAGARGLVVLLDSLVAVTRGEAPARPEYPRPAASARPAPAREAEPQYEVMYLLTDSDERRVAALRARLGELGDSVVVVGDGSGSWSAHVHCADAGAAVEAGIAAGRLSRIRVENVAFASHAELSDVSIGAADRSGGAGRDPGEPFDGGAFGTGATRVDGIAGSAPAADSTQVVAGALGPSAAPAGVPADRGILAVVAGAGAAALFEDAGAVVLADEPVTASTLLAAIRRMPNREVLVLPNGALPAHELVAVGVAARDAHRDVLLLPSGSMVQGLAAVAVHDRGRIAVDDAFAMSEAAATTRWGSLRVATERALTMVGTCAPGDGLGLAGHDVVVIERDVRAAGRTLLDRLLAFGGELVTLLMGAAAPDGLGDELAAYIARHFPGVEVIVYSGGQQGDSVQIGVE